ncbi:Uncharacterised protein [uncultured Ruminococcus sp.]|uniref:Bacteriocin transport accessory protein n=1 Tax=Massiliimalia timonensis TaxID=1987501 RepID=A0A8J6P8W5_9FIRM|nr:bacteriocin transport accessory protein [Massiliimalia timonensis]MBC8611895.1 bacteriocin transport accessory protein [Massiliimalia timonensis]SCG93244.1 Uncharacterised protein [uncultured Clostridium sp.]SCH88890.1 Uncharacterised protein [uncultured Ruminococcus sp.]
MKKLTAILLVAVLSFSFTACSKNSGSDFSSNPESNNSQQITAKDAVELLTAVWKGYPEDNKFAAMGGDLSEENATTDAPGKFDLSDPTALDSTLGFPSALVDKIDDAASLIHMMNANTFTCGTYHVKSSDDINNLAKAIKDNILQKQWMCGFPDKLIIVSVGDYIVSFYGNNEVLGTFQAQLTSTYPSSKVILEEPIA